MNTLRKIISKIQFLFQKKYTPKQFYDICADYLGSPFPGEYDAAKSINYLYEDMTKRKIGGELSSYELYWFLQNKKNLFEEVYLPDAGDIVISPTGLGSVLEEIGNVGVVGYEDQIFSINRANKKFDNHLLLKDWKEKYKGFPIKFFRIK